MTAAALRTAHAEATDPAEREHVTPFLYRRPERFALANMRNDCPLGREGWTVDTADDLEFVRRIVDAHGRRRVLVARGVGGGRARASTDDPDAVVLVPAGREHSAFFLACRNDADAVRHSRSQPHDRPRRARAVVRGEDRRSRVSGCASRWCGGEPVGTVRVDVRGGVGEVGIAVAPTFRGQGLGHRAARSAARRRRDRSAGRGAHRGGARRQHARRCARSPRVGFVANGADGEFRLLRHDLGTDPRRSRGPVG